MPLSLMQECNTVYIPQTKGGDEIFTNELRKWY